ncbi:hypothetical protein J437_LFUL006278 [Ladona fulva]|uniref:Ubiquitin-like modifier-activating enzyme ATG7 n=1 Tax=Ladona fulva TaxID=123851 RepID=A0A8K0JYN8_LADFU|nr:hypothetical protein J437_LFUL006278 [Ladona fulva]
MQKVFDLHFYPGTCSITFQLNYNMSVKEESQILQYAPFMSTVEPGFWHNLSQLKLDVDRLNENERKIWGYYSSSVPPGSSMALFVDFSAFNKNFTVDATSLPANGILLNKNTLESFKECDKLNLLESYGTELVNQMKNGDAVEKPSLLCKFILLTFADLKKYQFYYWFAFLAPKFADTALLKPPQKIGTVFGREQIDTFEELYSAISDTSERAFLTVTLTEEGNISILPLKEFGDALRQKNQRTFLAFSDPSILDENPGWPLRNLLALIKYKWYCISVKRLFLLKRYCHSLIVKRPEVVGSALEVIGIRRKFDGVWNADRSVIFSVMLGKDDTPLDKVNWVGWEKNQRGKFGPRMTHLGSTMDPLRLAETSVDLNLKLMKWRLLPELDLNVVKDSHVLLLGAGTLGCCVARLLMAWGVRNITFVDNGRVSYSNPVRQMLFTFKDCQNGGRLKAEAAADALKEIFPGVASKGVKLSIPMPGHPVGEGSKKEVEEAVDQLKELIKNHDLIFQLTDTRESRWLPTLIAAHYGKLTINAALGFDTFLVMRHGITVVDESSQSDDVEAVIDYSSKFIKGSQLGCYFCNDVVAPGNSTRDRTLDQQCTVTRPGISLLASSLAVELAVSLLQHPMRGLAPACCSSKNASVGKEENGGDGDCERVLEKELQSHLGLVPHSIRGFLSQFELVVPATHRFSCCVACSHKVLNEFKIRGFEFLCQVFNKPGYLEDLTGLTKLHQESASLEVRK